VRPRAIVQALNNTGAADSAERMDDPDSGVVTSDPRTRQRPGGFTDGGYAARVMPCGEPWQTEWPAGATAESTLRWRDGRAGRLRVRGQG
jgi:hypothetical protein